MADISSISNQSGPDYLSQLLKTRGSSNGINTSELKGMLPSGGGNVNAAQFNDLLSQGIGSVKGLDLEGLAGSLRDASPFETSSVGNIHQARNSGPTFADGIRDFIEGVDAKQKTSRADVLAVMTGQSNNIHQAMISKQESGVAFTMMVEVRNKLMESFQEIMRMQV